MPRLETQTGKVFPSSTEAVTFMRDQVRIMLDPGEDAVTSSVASTELAHAFLALDQHMQKNPHDIADDWKEPPVS